MVAMNVWPTDGAAGSVATEAKWRKMARAYAPSGVMVDQGGAMAPSLAGTNLTIRAGAAWVDGHYAELTGDQVLTATANGLAVIRFDPAANTAELLYRDAATVPAQAPAGTWELPLAKIVASVLTDVRPLLNPAGGLLAYPNQTARLLVPPAYDGQLVMQTDNGQMYQYLGALGTWRNGPWQAGRGLVSPGVFSPPNFNFTTTLTASALQAYNLQKGRSYMAFGNATVNSLTLSGIIDTLSFGNSSATPIQQFPVTPANTSGLYGVTFAALIQPAADVSYGLRVYAQASGGGSTPQTVQNISFWIIDIGSNGDPV